MKSPTGPQSATSLPRAPRDDAESRTLRYFWMMAIRVVCFILMVVIMPYGWHTLLLGIGAVALPYVAVVIANVGQDTRRAERETPERALTAAASVEAPPPAAPQVIRIQEVRAVDAPAEEETPRPPENGS